MNSVAVAVAEWVARQTAEQEVGGLNPGIPLLLWGRRLAVMVALYTGKGVSPEVNLRECMSFMLPQSSNKAEPTLSLKPRGDIMRSPKQGYEGYQSLRFNKNYKKKNSSPMLPNMPMSCIHSLLC